MIRMRSSTNRTENSQVGSLVTILIISDDDDDGGSGGCEDDNVISIAQQHIEL